MNEVLQWSEDHPKAKVLARTQTAILHAARGLFLSEGFERTKMEAVATAAGVAIMTLYRHFRTKEALFRAVMEAACCGRARVQGDPLAGRSPEDALAQFGAAVIRLLVDEDQVAVRRIVIAEARRFPELGRMWVETGPALGIADATTLFREIAPRIGVDVDVEEASGRARSFIAALDRLPQKVLLGETRPSDEEIEAEAARLARVFVGRR